jgi:hypothetical protein
MPIIDFHMLSIPDAEEAIAETWRILEECGIPSPDMTFSFRGSSRVKIALRVDDPVDAQTLILRLAPLAALVDRRDGAPPKMQPTRFPHALLSSVAPSRFLRTGHDRHRRPHSAIWLS